jgi:omega-6 fatty acid desaturase (delta-12 desaturase)
MSAHAYATATPAENDAKAWLKILSGYRQPSMTRSSFELFVTVLPFILISAAAYVVGRHGVLAGYRSGHPGVGLPAALFMIQHDCGHGSFFRPSRLDDWTGRVIGVLTLTPYDYWRRTHAAHHATAGNLDERGIGDISTLTVAEYRALSARNGLAIVFTGIRS